MTIISKITQPHAAILIWNYIDRMVQPQGATSDTQDTEEVYIASSSVRSIKTAKSKSSPTGTFDIELAPTHNWVAKLTVGSWLAILMTQDKPLLSNGVKSSTAQFDELKMLGRIDSVRMAVSVNASTGTRQTGFIVSGRDWGSIFDCTVYIDTLAQAPVLAAPAVAIGSFFGQTNINYEMPESNKFIYSTTSCMHGIRFMYGGGAKRAFDTFEKGMFENLSIVPDQIFHIPKAVSDYFSIKNDSGMPSIQLSDALTIVSGKLTGKDTYDLKHEESVGLPDLGAMMGQHTFWQVLLSHSNPVLNETFAELRWSEDSLSINKLKNLATNKSTLKPSLALYKRIRPFVVSPLEIAAEMQVAKTKNDNSFPLSLAVVKDLISEYKYVKSTEIPLEDIIFIDAGTNWRDRINFIEILFDDSVIKKSASLLPASIKAASQIKDKNASTREGLKPLLVTTKFFPPPDKIANFSKDKSEPFAPLAVTCWKHLLKSWYFNTHNMLNGSITLIGQNNFIGVGENLLIPVEALNLNPNFFIGMTQQLQKKQIFLLVHIESLSHTFAISDSGARSFTTSIQFVRGIFTDQNGELIYPTPGPGVIDSNATFMPDQLERFPNVVHSTTITDPDRG
jgi:hypothetical protein